MSAAEALFWISLAVVVYVYAGYPLLLAIAARVAPWPVRRSAWEPTVSIVIAARNERATIVAKVADCLAAEYPAEKLQVVVSLDGCSDGTDRVLAELRHQHPRLVVVASRRHDGKAAALNRGVARARGEVVVFCDVRQRLDPGAVRALVAALADPDVGAATGELVLTDERGSEAADGVGLYWRYEKALRALESRVHSTLGATGALYAVRRVLYRPLPDGTVLDDVLTPMRIVLAGQRVVYEPRARAYDRVCPPELEFVRKVRTLAGNFQLLVLAPELVNPARNPVFFQFVSHKLGRLAVPYFLVLLLAANCWLREGWYQLTLAAQGGFYLLAAAGALVRRGGAPPAPVYPTRAGELQR
jgi:cellulose synthase/poly-beta-1,6-N-acetylglucosamine synthase-like glycosyltransferase